MKYWKTHGDASKQLWEIERIIYEFDSRADAGGDINYEEGIEIAIRIRDVMQERIDELNAQLNAE